MTTEPTFMRFRRVQNVLEKEPSLARKLGEKTETVWKENGTGAKDNFSPEVVQVTVAIHNEGLDAQTLNYQEIIQRAIAVLVLKTVKVPRFKSQSPKQEPLIKRRRGRPPKVVIPVENEVKTDVESEVKTEVKRRRGRPPKVVIPVESEVKTEVKRRRGRPPKVARPISVLPTTEVPKSEPEPIKRKLPWPVLPPEDLPDDASACGIEPIAEPEAVPVTEAEPELATEEVTEAEPVAEAEFIAEPVAEPVAEVASGSDVLLEAPLPKIEPVVASTARSPTATGLVMESRPEPKPVMAGQAVVRALSIGLPYCPGVSVVSLLVSAQQIAEHYDKEPGHEGRQKIFDDLISAYKSLTIIPRTGVK